MMKKTVLITGGAKSGKSDFALKVASKEQYVNRYFIATAEPLDDEMKNRIEKHRKERDPQWITLEEPVKITEIIKSIDTPETVTVVDCLTLWVSNLLMIDDEISKIEEIFFKLIQVLRDLKNLTIYLVTNEVGMGIVPENSISRLYRDLLGKLNQMIAKEVDEVYLLISGLPLRIK